MPERSAAEIRAVPEDFDQLVEWVDRIGRRLVLLEEYPLSDLRDWVDAVERGIRSHLAEFGDLGGAAADPSGAPGARASTDLLADDHARFLVSMEQLRWFFRVVERDDHGGNRQALGQYGRVLAEALRRHRRDERSYLARATFGPPVATR